MQLSMKESSLIEVLLSEKQIVTAKEIADRLKISTKTVYRLVKKLNELSSKGEIIETQRGKGLVLNYDSYLELIQDPFVPQDQNSEERRNQILLQMLFKSPNQVNLNALYENQFVSQELIYKDLEKIKEAITPYHLTLKKKRNFISIEGAEKFIRRLSYNLISIGSFLNNESYVVNNETINTYDADFITSMLEMIERTTGCSIPYPYNVNVFSHLYILLSRFRNGRVHDTDISTLEELDNEEQYLINQHGEKFQLAEKVIQRTNHYLNTKLPEIEVFYLFQYILSSRMDAEIGSLEYGEAYDQIKPIAEFMVNSLEKDLAASFTVTLEDEEFLEHLRLMIYRIRNGIIIKNEMKQDIRREYSAIYEALERIANEMLEKFSMARISEDEIGFLVLYFAKVLEQVKFKKRVLIMCSSGVGTSELLKVKVQRAFPDLEIVDVVSFNQYKKKYEKIGREAFDFILTTVSLENKSSLPSLLVNFMFTQQDQENVMKLLEGI